MKRKGKWSSVTQSLVLAACVGILSLISACRKTPKADPHESVFVNQHNESIFVRVYDGLENYVNSGEPVWETQLGPLDKVHVSPEDLPTGKTYYIDWFSEDYTLHNWYNSQDLYPQIRPEPGANSFDISRDLKGAARLTFLNGSGKTTRWKAVDKLLFSSTHGFVSYWDTATVQDRHRFVDVSKDFKAQYRYREDTGGEKTKLMDIIVHPNAVPLLEFVGDGGEMLGSMIGGRLPSGTGPDYYSASTDSVLALFSDSEFYYLMVKY